MTVPSYTAEASLYETRERYQSVAAQIYGGRQRAIPQIGLGGGLGGGGLGGLNAWGCWQSWCCTCSWHQVCNSLGCRWDCCDEPCTRCIWPY